MIMIIFVNINIKFTRIREFVLVFYIKKQQSLLIDNRIKKIYFLNTLKIVYFNLMILEIIEYTSLLISTL